MRTFPRIAVIVPLLVSAWPVRNLVAQHRPAHERLTLTAAIERAVVAFPTVAAAKAGSDEARAVLGEAKAAWFPSLHLTASATQFEEPMAVTPIHGFTPGSIPPFDETLIQGAATMSFTVFDGGARSARIRAASRSAEAADASAASVEQELIESVVRTFVRVLTQREVIAAHDQRLAALVTERTRANDFLAAGRGAEVAVLRADAAVAEAEAVRVSLLAGLDVAIRDLARLIGASPDTLRAQDLQAVELRDSTVPNREDAVAQALTASPSVERARLEAAAASASIGVARGARWPALALVGRVIDRGSAQGDYTTEWDAGLQLSYPIFTGGATSNRIAQARARESGAAEHLRLAELEAAAGVDRALAAVEESRARIASLQRAVAGFTEVARVEKLRLDTGTGTQTDYLKAEADLLKARADLATARYALLTARAALALAMGQLSQTWVTAHVETAP